MNAELLSSDYVRDLIRIKANALSRTRTFRLSSAADIEQDLWLAVSERLDRYRPSRGSFSTFIDRIVSSVIVDRFRSRHRAQRASGPVLSLNSLPVDRCDADSCSTISFITAEDRARRLGTSEADPIATLERSEALAVALDRMPADLRAFAEALMEESGIDAAAEKLGLSTRRRRLALAMIRDHLRLCGLEKCE